MKTLPSWLAKACGAAALGLALAGPTSAATITLSVTDLAAFSCVAATGQATPCSAPGPTGTFNGFANMGVNPLPNPSTPQAQGAAYQGSWTFGANPPLYLHMRLDMTTGGRSAIANSNLDTLKFQVVNTNGMPWSFYAVANENPTSNAATPTGVNNTQFTSLATSALAPTFSISGDFTSPLVYYPITLSMALDGTPVSTIDLYVRNTGDRTAEFFLRPADVPAPATLGLFGLGLGLLGVGLRRRQQA